MNSKSIKSIMLFKCLYELHYIGAVTEYGGRGCDGIADIFALLDSGFTHEFEIKVSKQDLDSELKAIEFHLNPTPPLDRGELEMERYRGMNKSLKHRLYLSGNYTRWGTIISVPNKFSFIVPEKLADYAKEKLKNTPYGLWIAKDGLRPDINWSIKAKFLHKEKAPNDLILGLLRRASLESHSLLGKVRAYETTISTPTEVPR